MDATARAAAAPVPPADVVPTVASPAAPAAPSLLGEIYAGFRRNLVPGLILQALALAVALCYFCWPAGKTAIDGLAAFRNDHGGYAAGAVISAICGGLIPWLVTKWRGELPKEAHPAWDCIYMMVYWAWAGFEVDVFYAWQGVWWGQGATAGSLSTFLFGGLGLTPFLLGVFRVAGKVAVDQFVFTPFLALPQMRLCYRWRESGYRANAWNGLTIRKFLREIMVLAGSAWVVWIPGCSIIYSMPTGIQFLLFALVLVFWSLVSQMAGRSRQPVRAG